MRKNFEHGVSLILRQQMNRTNAKNSNDSEGEYYCHEFRPLQRFCSFLEANDMGLVCTTVFHVPCCFGNNRLKGHSAVFGVSLCLQIGLFDLVEIVGRWGEGRDSRRRRWRCIGTGNKKNFAFGRGLTFATEWQRGSAGHNGRQ
jgi:hypothetical protein